jgi:hypothetical protein
MARARAQDRTSIRWLFVLSALLPAVSSGCAIVPRSRLEESQRLTQTLRAENARLKDQVLALQGQNRDYADRAVDDLRRSAAQDQAIERLEQSVQAYQEDRDRLHEAYERLTASLGMRPSPTAALRDSLPPGRGPGGQSRGSEPDEEKPKGVTGVDDEETRPERSRAGEDQSGP